MLEGSPVMSDFPLIDYIDHGPQSRNDAHRVVQQSVSERRAAVLGAIIRAGSAGVTLDELADAFDCSPNAISGRITELKRLGLVRHTEHRRKTRSGSSASVIVAGGGM
jgi:predicted transcriptional regulator